MIHDQAAKLAIGLADKRIIDEDSHEVYTYGLELIISAIINMLILAIISIAFHRYYDWLLFLVAFAPLRTTAGGYHASSHMKCIVVGSIGFSVLLAVCRLQINWRFAVLAIAALSLLMILVFSPIEARNKKLEEKRRKKNRTTSICIGAANLLIAVTAIFVQGLSDVLSVYFAGIFAATLSMLAVKIQKNKGG